MGETQGELFNAAPKLLPTTHANIHERVSSMHSSPLFRGISAAECFAFATKSREQAFVRSQRLFRQGDSVQQIGLIRSGVVKVTQLSSSGSEVILWLNGAGESFGFFGLSPDEDHSCSASAVDRGSAVVWNHRDFMSFVNENPIMRRNVTHILANRLEELQERFREIATEKIADRVAHLLVRLGARIGKRCKEGFEIILSRGEIAQMTGTTLFAISRLFSEWEALGLVLPRREAVVIIDPQRLGAFRSDDTESSASYRIPALKVARV
jgi:CRP/FNR family transcriptional regulator, nitrogen oxide reductase regulator